MAQLSIFEKQRHFSDKDLTVSIGKYDTIYITFRHDSWKRFTDSDYIAVAIKNGVLIFRDPDVSISWKSFKLKQTHGNPETYEHTRYVQISGKAWPEFLKASRNMVGSFNFDEVDKDDEKIEEELEELIAPKGFIVLTKSKFHDAVMFRVDDILQIEEFFGEDIKIVTKIFPDIRVEETFEEVIEAINKALEV